MKRVISFVVGIGVLFLFAPNSSATVFTSSKYYVGLEDSASGSCDCDFNDLIIQLNGSGLQLVSGGILNSPIVPSTSGTPFWNNLSSDGANKNIGNCMYSSGASNACMPGGMPINATAQYLSTAGGASVDFSFSFSGAPGVVTVIFWQHIAASPDQRTLYYCPTGSNVTGGPGGTCHLLDFGASPTSGSTTLTFTPTGAFDLVEWSNVGIGPYSSLRTDTGTLDTSLNHFVAFASTVAPVPEPATLGLVGLALVSLAALKRRRKS